MTIRAARIEEAIQLTAIALKAKRHWGYPEHWIQQWTKTLTITPEYIGRHVVQVAERDGRTVGFNGVQILDDTALLDHLWVLPDMMRCGIGRRLFEQAENTAKLAGATRLKIVADPHVEEFYRKMGAVTVGREPASPDGQERFLPLMEKSLRPN